MTPFDLLAQNASVVVGASDAPAPAFDILAMANPYLAAAQGIATGVQAIASQAQGMANQAQPAPEPEPPPQRKLVPIHHLMNKPPMSTGAKVAIAGGGLAVLGLLVSILK